jgi:hypothetical protein
LKDAYRQALGDILFALPEGISVELCNTPEYPINVPDEDEEDPAPCISGTLPISNTQVESHLALFDAFKKSSPGGRFTNYPYLQTLRHAGIHFYNSGDKKDRVLYKQKNPQRGENGFTSSAPGRLQTSSALIGALPHSLHNSLSELRVEEGDPKRANEVMTRKEFAAAMAKRDDVNLAHFQELCRRSKYVVFDFLKLCNDYMLFNLSNFSMVDRILREISPENQLLHDEKYKPFEEALVRQENLNVPDQTVLKGAMLSFLSTSAFLRRADAEPVRTEFLERLKMKGDFDEKLSCTYRPLSLDHRNKRSAPAPTGGSSSKKSKSAKTALQGGTE